MRVVLSVSILASFFLQKKLLGRCQTCFGIYSLMFCLNLCMFTLFVDWSDCHMMVVEKKA